jgi:single-strand DNA-binding protein
VSYSKTLILGTLVRDCEVRFAQSGTAICKFSLAVNERFKDKDGEWKERTDFIEVVLFGKRGEAFAKFHSKGSTAFIEGVLRQDHWEDKTTGQKRSKVFVKAESWEFVGARPAQGDGFDAPASSREIDETPY